ncbi:MAG: bifunctional nuclease family protein [Chloroflexota bacterium]
MLELVIDSIRVSLVNYQRVVILKERESDRFLPIWIGQLEADAIALKLQDMTPPRPMTHDLMHHVLSDLGGVVDRIIVSGLDHDTFFAKVMVTAAGRTITVDARPSDALALAVRAKAPIFAEESVLEHAGVRLDRETGKAIVGESGASSATVGEGEPGGAPDEHELERMSAFKDFIDSLDLDDLGDSSGREG